MPGKKPQENIFRALLRGGFVEILNGLVERGEMSYRDAIELAEKKGLSAMTARHAVRSLRNFGLAFVTPINGGVASAHNPLRITPTESAKTFLAWYEQSRGFLHGFQPSQHSTD